MSTRELDRLQVLGRVADKRLTQREAAVILGVTEPLRPGTGDLTEVDASPCFGRLFFDGTTNPSRFNICPMVLGAGGS